MLEEKLREIALALESCPSSLTCREFEAIESLITDKFTTSNEGWADVIICRNSQETVVVRLTAFESLDNGLIIIAQRQSESAVQLAGKNFVKGVLYFPEEENIDLLRERPKPEENRTAFLEKRVVFFLDPSRTLYPGPAIELLRENSII